MFACVLEAELRLPGARSLKDRRRVIKSVKERLKKRFNAAVIETGDKDKWQTAGLGVCFLSERKSDAERLAQQALSFILGDYRLEVTRHTVTVH